MGCDSIQIHMHHRGPCFKKLNQIESRRTHRAFVAKRINKSPHERGLPRAQFTVKQHDVADAKLSGKPCPQIAHFVGAVNGKLLAQTPPSRRTYSAMSYTSRRPHWLCLSH